MKEIRSTRGLQELLRRYQEAKADEEWIKTIKGCIIEGLAMDEDDYDNTPENLKKCWKGLR